MKHIAVIGCGRWGSFLAWYADRIGHRVTLYGRSGSKNMQRFLETRSNDYLHLPESVTLSTAITDVLEADVLIVSIASQSLRGLLGELRAVGYDTHKTPLVLCMKGLELPSGKRLSQVAAEELGEDARTAVWLGPGHAQEFVRDVPNCMVIDSADEALKAELIDIFSSERIRFYYGTDLLGNEIGAAAKNVIGIAAGMLDGKGLGTLKGALMSRGTREISRLIDAMGGNGVSAYGLCHLGDYEATVFSQHSQNRRFGELYVQGKSYDKLAEGYFTVQALVRLAEEYGVEMPICSCLYGILFEGRDAVQSLSGLFTRSLRNEF